MLNLRHIDLTKNYMMFFKTPMPQETLDKYVARIMNDKNLSGYDIERRTRKRITQSYANRIKNGEVRNPSPEKLQVLAIGLDVPEQELFDVVLGVKITRNSQKETDLLRYFRELPNNRQDDLVLMARTFFGELHKGDFEPVQGSVAFVRSEGEIDALPREKNIKGTPRRRSALKAVK